MDFTGRTPLYRLGKTKRLVFMAGLAVEDEPKSECAFRHGQRVAERVSRFKRSVSRVEISYWLFVKSYWGGEDEVSSHRER
jgi:hypothetical protein